jgi:RNA polymerase sigma factor (sigma-70 family)
MALSVHRSSEQELVAGCKKRNRTAQQELYTAYSGKMYALCSRYVKSSMEAEDVLVTAFTKVFDKIDQFKSEGSFEGWIRRIVVNEALTWLRKNRSMYVETTLEQADREFDYNQVSDHLEAQDLLKMVQQLPTGYQLVFNLYAIDGYSHKEIAEQLNISENTSKSQLSRARVYLQKLLFQYQWDATQTKQTDEATT